VSVFDRLHGYGFVHHRALNSPSALAAAYRHILDHPTRSHILEGDLCWDFTPGNEELYFRHPSFVFDTLGPDQIRQERQRKALVSLEDLTDLRDGKAFLVVELKVGRGNTKAALRKLIDYLEQNFPERYWIDGFSLKLLEYIKTVSSGTAVTLHTECVYRQQVLVASPQWPPPKLQNMSALRAIDGIAIRRRGSESFMARACADVHAAGKTLLLSRLHTLRHFECSKVWGAKGGYMHWDFAELVRFNDDIDATHSIDHHG
jgi:Uma2 family endonuclease